MNTPNFLTLYQGNVTVIQTTTGEQTVTKENPFGGFNLGLHVKDNPNKVHENRAILLAQIQTQFPKIQRIHWLNQVHGNDVSTIANNLQATTIDADAHITTANDVALAIMTADCVPIVISGENGEIVGAVHAGWQGLAKNIIANTVEKMKNQLNMDNIKHWQAWIGACIAQQNYEIDERVKNAILASIELSPSQIDEVFLANSEKKGHYFANLAKIAEIQLNRCGVETVYQSKLDSYADNRFYSYRQQTQQNFISTGRMATLIFRSADI